MLDASQTLGILDRVVEQFVGHSAFRRSPKARRLAHRLVDFVVAEIQRAGEGTLAPAPRPIPDTSGWLELLQDLVDEGLPGYDSGDARIAQLLGQLMAVLSPDDQRLLTELEAAFNARTQRLAEDRFRFGVAVGRSNLSDVLLAGHD